MFLFVLREQIEKWMNKKYISMLTKCLTLCEQNKNQDEKPGKVYITDDLDKFTDDEK